MQADEVVRPRPVLGQTRDRQRGGIGREQDVGAGRLGRAARGLGLDLALFEHRLDDDVAAGQRGIVGGRRDAGEHRRAAGGVQASALHFAAEEFFGVRLAALGQCRLAVQQGRVQTGRGAGVGDAAAHQTGAQHADLAVFGLGYAGRAALELAGVVQGQEAAADQVFRLHRGGRHAEIAALDVRADLDRRGHALIHARQDVDRRWVVAGGALVHLGNDDRQEFLHARIACVAAGHPKALAIPGLLGLAAGQNPGLGLVQQLSGRHHGMDDSELEGLCHRQARAFHQQRHRRAHADQPRQALSAAGARQYAQRDFRQADAGLGVVGGDAVVAGQRQFQSAAQRRAVDGRDHRFAGRLQAPEHAVDGMAAGFEARRPGSHGCRRRR